MEVALRERMVVFLDDLRKFNEDTLLENYTDSSFMSETYFTLGEIDMLKNRTVGKKMLGQRLDDLFEKRIEEDGMICSSHDLYPLYCLYFDVRKTELSPSRVKYARSMWKTWSKDRRKVGRGSRNNIKSLNL